MVYDATISTDPAPLFASTTGKATIAGLTFESDGVYTSRQACQTTIPASFQTTGTIDQPTTPQAISATFQGVECGRPFTGILTLARAR
jgi:hypothetical protein